MAFLLVRVVDRQATGEAAVGAQRQQHRSGEHAGGLLAQELPPTGVGMPQRSRWDAVSLQDPPNRRGTHAVAEPEQLALVLHQATLGR